MSLSPRSLRSTAGWLRGLFFFVVTGCDGRCSRDIADAAKQRGAFEGIPLNAIDCPDGLARCRDGRVEVSRLAAIRRPCAGPAVQCACPWEQIATCSTSCVVENVEVVMEPPLASTQLCAPSPDAAPWTSFEEGAGGCGSCREGQLFRCAQAEVRACRGAAQSAACLRGCAVEGAAIDEGEPAAFEAAVAILCAR